MGLEDVSTWRSRVLRAGSIVVVRTQVSGPLKKFSGFDWLISRVRTQ